MDTLNYFAYLQSYYSDLRNYLFTVAITANMIRSARVNNNVSLSYNRNQKP